MIRENLEVKLSRCFKNIEEQTMQISEGRAFQQVEGTEVEVCLAYSSITKADSSQRQIHGPN